jgi:hypothetical protein
MPKVYVPMIPSRFDTSVEMWIPTINIDPAKRHGEIEVLAPANANRLAIGPLMEVMRQKMRGFKPEDFVCAVGDPSLIAMAVAVAVQKTGGVRLLKWDRLASDYLVIDVKP